VVSAEDEVKGIGAMVVAGATVDVVKVAEVDEGEDVVDVVVARCRKCLLVALEMTLCQQSRLGKVNAVLTDST
jgi:hypothetical protein